MTNPITLGYSPLIGKIYAGRSKPAKGMAEGVRIFTADKFDVTDQAIGIVADKLAHDGKPIKWIYADGRVMTLSVVITEPQQEAHHIVKG
ncbi:TPA: hypothetical protein ACHW2M_004546 [Yersinia enterocolitica]|nr:hypothetical protein [Yersinia enterocolitica]HDL6735980.1 hypothetical protein [Yersinia enterocolitica]HDM8313182.1 hypothetical protein [Yersinia enterocolitica]HDU2654271.1 hypothetical protein [Yersinia enterocolitica]HDV7144666.1 hypothetical protein [Yersinia enterocolitica]